MNKLLMKYLPVFAAEGLGGEGGGGDDTNSGGDDTAARQTALTGDNPADDKSSEGETPDDKSDDEKSEDEKEKQDGDDKGNDKTDADPQALELTAPEGHEHQQEHFQQFTEEVNEFLKENPKATTQELLQDIATKHAEKVAAAEDESVEQWNTQLTKWEEVMKKDEVLSGGEGFDANLAVAKKAIDKYGDEDLSNLLQSSGLGSHPGLVRIFYEVGKTMKEAGVNVATGESTDKPKNMTNTLQDGLYG